MWKILGFPDSAMVIAKINFSEAEEFGRGIFGGWEYPYENKKELKYTRDDQA